LISEIQILKQFKAKLVGKSLSKRDSGEIWVSYSERSEGVHGLISSMEPLASLAWCSMRKRGGAVNCLRFFIIIML
jgi:hypothetical protein